MFRMTSLFLMRSTVLLAVAFIIKLTYGVERIFVGETICRDCHPIQYNQCRLMKHSQAYAALAMPESKEIARLSGVAVDPFKSPICLGCHTTASQTDTWERDDSFYFEDGIQCEACHGRGSEYMVTETMMYKDVAIKAGLEMPGEDFCMICHNEKGSHTAVLKVKKFNYKEALWRLLIRERA